MYFVDFACSVIIFLIYYYYYLLLYDNMFWKVKCLGREDSINNRDEHTRSPISTQHLTIYKTENSYYTVEFIHITGKTRLHNTKYRSKIMHSIL